MRLARYAFSVLCAASVFMCAGVVNAQQPRASRENMRRAVVLFEESEVAYNEGRFEEAAAMLRRAYALHADPTLLFNLARAEEGMGDLVAAIDSYQRYLDSAPEAPDRGAIEARIATLQRQRDQIQRGETAEADLVDEPEPIEDPEPEPIDPEPQDEGEGGGIDLVPWVVAGVGVAVVGVGVAFGLVSDSKESAAMTEPVQTTAVELHSEAKTFATLANVFFVVGGLAAAAGIAWGVVSLTSGGGDDADEPEVEAALVPGGVLVHGRF